MKSSGSFLLVCALCFVVSTYAAISGQEGPTRVKSKRYMETSFTISDGGYLQAKTRTWSKKKLKGFTGGVLISLLDGTKSVIWTSKAHKYGVNGKWLGKSDRTEIWTDQVPVEAVKNARSYAIVHVHTPTNRFWKKAFKWAKDNLPTILKVAKLIPGLG